MGKTPSGKDADRQIDHEIDRGGRQQPPMRPNYQIREREGLRDRSSGKVMEGHGTRPPPKLGEGDKKRERD